MAQILSNANLRLRSDFAPDFHRQAVIGQSRQLVDITSLSPPVTDFPTKNKWESGLPKQTEACDAIIDGIVDEKQKMFDAVDADGSGEMDVDEFREFIESNALAEDMSFEIFYEAMFQLAQLWVATPHEKQYKKFLEGIFNAITEPGGKLKDLMVEGRGVDDGDLIADKKRMEEISEKAQKINTCC